MQGQGDGAPDIHALNAKAQRMPIRELELTLRSLSLSAEGSEDGMRARLQKYYYQRHRADKDQRKQLQRSA